MRKFRVKTALEIPDKNQTIQCTYKSLAQKQGGDVELLNKLNSFKKKNTFKSVLVGIHSRALEVMHIGDRLQKKFKTKFFTGIPDM